MRDLSAETFRQHLLEKSLPARARSRVEPPANAALTRPLRELWEATDLSAAEFADKVSDYWGVVRPGLPQRPVRLLCDRCKVPHWLTPSDIDKDPRLTVIGSYADEMVHEACGCERCGGTGYRGRKGECEILEMIEDVRRLLGWQTESHAIDTVAMRGGMATMLVVAVRKCRAGVTTVPEVFRVATVR
jgi:hypothetical protein